MDGRRRKTVHAARRPEERPKDASHSSTFTECTAAMLTLPSFAGPTSGRSVTRTVRMRFSVGTAIAGESYELTAQSESDATLVYQWDVRGGTIEPDDAQTVVWTAPETAVVAWIHVDVTHADGATAGQSAYVRVEVPEPEPVPALPFLDWAIEWVILQAQSLLRR